MNSSNSNLPSNPSLSRNLNAASLLERLSKGEQLILVDVREPVEFHTFNMGGTNIPLGELEADIIQLEPDKSKEIIIICKVGLRSATAQSVLEQLGYTNVKNLEGGLMAVQRIQFSK